jgi:putative transposase
MGTRDCGIDLGCLTAVSIISTDGGNKRAKKQIYPPQFLRKAEKQIKHFSKAKRRKRAPNRPKKVKASSRYKMAQRHVSKAAQKVARQRDNWVHDIASRVLKSGHSLVAMEKLEVTKMTRKANKGKRKKHKAGLHKSILDVVTADAQLQNIPNLDTVGFG